MSRRERFERFGDSPPPELEAPPEFELPDGGLYLWDWYFSLSKRLRRVFDGVCSPVPPSEFLAWCEASGTIVHPSEYDILCAMDEAFCEETNKEIRDFQERDRERRKQEIEAAKRGR